MFTASETDINFAVLLLLATLRRFLADHWIGFPISMQQRIISNVPHAPPSDGKEMDALDTSSKAKDVSFVGYMNRSVQTCFLSNLNRSFRYLSLCASEEVTLVSMLLAWYSLIVWDTLPTYKIFFGTVRYILSSLAVAGRSGERMAPRVEVSSIVYSIPSIRERLVSIIVPSQSWDNMKSIKLKLLRSSAPTPKRFWRKASNSNISISFTASM